MNERLKQVHKSLKLSQEFVATQLDMTRTAMVAGEEETVKLRCENYLAGVMIDRFGKDVALIPDGEEHFIARVHVAVSRQFLSWVMPLGEGAKIVGPEAVVAQVNEVIERLIRQYRG